MEKNGLKTGCRQGLVSLTALACLATVPGLAMAEEDGFFSKVLNNATYKAEGVLSAYRYAPPDPDDKGIEDDRLEAWTHFSIQSDTFINDYWTFGLGLETIASSYHGGEQGLFTVPGKGDGQGRYLDFSRLNLSYLGDTVEVLVGKAGVPIGVAELYSPADLYGRENLAFPQQSVDFGVWQVRSDVYLGSDRLTGIVMPLHESAPGPNDLSRWNGAGASGVSAYSNLGRPTLPGGIDDEDAEIIDGDNDNSSPAEWGYLLEYSGTLTGMDYFMTAYTGPSPYPVLELPPVGQENPYTKLYPTVNILSAGTTVIEGSWKFYGEGVGYWAPQGKDDDFVRMLVGVKYRETDFANRIGMDEITPIVEFSREWVLDKQDNADFSVSSEDARPNPENILASLTFTVNDEWKFGVAHDRSLREQDTLTQVFVRYQPNDNLWMSLGGMYFTGDEETMFGNYDANDNISFKLHRSF